MARKLDRKVAPVSVYGLSKLCYCEPWGGNEARDCVILGSLELSCRQAVENMVKSEMEDAGRRRSF